MFWLRWLYFSAPLWLVFGGVWLYGKAAGIRLERESDALVHAIASPVGHLDPLFPADGVTGEIADLLFEPLLRRDEDLNLRPNLIERWTTRSVITIRCASEEAAGEAEARIRSGEVPAKGPRPIALDRDETLLTVAFEGSGGDLEKALLADLPPELLGDYLLVRVRADHSVDQLIEAWLEGSIEKSQVRMLEFDGDREANLFVRGETDRVLKELRLYLASNPATRPLLEIVGERCHTSVREMLLDLRAGVAWHDGAPFTAEDVAFSFRELTKPDSPLPLASSFDWIESLEVVSPHRIRLRCRTTPATSLESWEKLPLLPAHLLGGSDGSLSYEDWAIHPVGLGPYQLESRRADGGVELTAHAAYHRGAPEEKHLRYRRFGSLESILLALRLGSLDVIEPDERFTGWSDRHPGTVETLRDRARFQNLVVWNLDRPPFDRPPVRNALARAIDLGVLLQDTTTEFQTPVTSLFFPGLPTVADPMLLPLHDPRGAERLLETEGYRLEETSGRRKDGKGKALGFTLLFHDSDPGHRRLASALAEQWSSVGLTVQIEALPWDELITRRVLPREFDAVLLSWEIPLGRDRHEVWHSDSARPGGGNLSGLRDSEVDRLLTVLRDEADPAKLTETTSALQRAIAALQPVLFLCDTGRILTLRKGGLAMQSPAATAPEAITIGKGGLEAVRPWWVRIDGGTP